MTEPPATIFVTVGTTLFEPLIENVSTSRFLGIVASIGYRRIVIQYGKGSAPVFASMTGDHDGSLDSSPSFGTIRVDVADNSSIDVDWEIYRFKPSLEKDMQTADLIISHAGAGSIMEGLWACRQRNGAIFEDGSTALTRNEMQYKKLIVIINDNLMNNHQSELAEALDKRGYLFMLNNPSLLLDDGKIKEFESFRPKIFSGGNASAFGNLLNDFMGTARKK